MDPNGLIVLGESLESDLWLVLFLAATVMAGVVIGLFCWVKYPKIR